MALSTKLSNPLSGASMEVQQKPHGIQIVFAGRLDAPSVAKLWDAACTAVSPGSSTVVDCSSLQYLDGAGVALLLKIRDLAEAEKGGSIHVEGLAATLQNIVDMSWQEGGAGSNAARPSQGFTRSVGSYVARTLHSLQIMITFVGEALAMIAGCLRSPRCIRWSDLWQSFVRVGADSLSIIVLIGFLMGLIMSFQSAVTLQRFGAEIYVPNMLGLVMFREMGPLVTSILLAARSGSAFAAEIGTMKVNEEVDALQTMGLSPIRFLVVPKVLSALLAVPFMTLFFNFASLVGGAVVMLSMGYPLVTFTSRVFYNLTSLDFAGGLFKACIFSLLVAGVGCLRGLETRIGASAVGDSTTSAVVSGIILIALADGLFALIFYGLGI